MNGTQSRNDALNIHCEQPWPRKVSYGRETVTIYRRKTPLGNPAFMVANYSEGKRRFDSYSTEADALAAATTLAERLSRKRNVAARLTEAEAVEYVNANQTLQPLKLSITDAVSTLAQAVKLVGDLSSVVSAAKFYAARHKQVTPKLVADVVMELIQIKASRGGSIRYLSDLRSRLIRFGSDFAKDIGNVTTADLQAWLDGLGLSSQSYTNYRRVLHLLFKFAVARGYAVDNPLDGVERIKVRGGDAEIFTPAEIARLLSAASPNFIPCLAIGAFAGLRSAEIERLDWKDIDLTGGFITVAASKSKTASRRIVPIQKNLEQWLAPYSPLQGRIWLGNHLEFYREQESTCAATAVRADPDRGIKEQRPVRWKRNGLRHSYASYRFAQTGDAGRVAGELGNSAAVVHRHYRQLARPGEAERWFAVRPEAPANIVGMTVATEHG